MTKLYPKALFLATVLCFIFRLNTHAQDKPDTISRDYVINLKGDTIKGQVLWVSDGAVKQDPFSQTHTVKYKADEITEARMTGQIYTPIKVALTFRNIVIVKRIKHGAIDLYEYDQQSTRMNGATASQSTWYASKAGVKVAEIKTSGMGGISRSDRKKNFMALIADNEEVTKKFLAQTDFSFTVLWDLIAEYNQDAEAKKAKS